MKKNQWVHRIFFVGLIIKGINGVLEIIGGVLLWVITLEQVNKIVNFLTWGEFREDVNDWIANVIQKSAMEMALNARTVASIFLLSTGMIKMALIIALLKKKLWVYPLALSVFSLFALFFIYRFLWSGAFFMLILCIFDIFVVLFTYLEYKRIKKEIFL